MQVLIILSKERPLMCSQKRKRLMNCIQRLHASLEHFSKWLQNSTLLTNQNAEQLSDRILLYILMTESQCYWTNMVPYRLYRPIRILCLEYQLGLYGSFWSLAACLALMLPVIFIFVPEPKEQDHISNYERYYKILLMVSACLEM